MASPQGYRLSETNPVAERILRPRYLCVLREKGEPAECVLVEEWMRQHKSERNLSYVFIAYTAEQFQDNDSDNIALDRIADAAARNAGVSAYWIGNCCMPDEAHLEDDVGTILDLRIFLTFNRTIQVIPNTQQVHRICDVIRGAHSLAIAVGRPANDLDNITTIDLMLQQWGTRVWTFPEVLLAPEGKPIRVYERGADLLQPLLLEKNQFAAKVWKQDAHVARQVRFYCRLFSKSLLILVSWLITTREISS
jgi:hypothetical protein